MRAFQGLLFAVFQKRDARFIAQQSRNQIGRMNSAPQKSWTTWTAWTVDGMDEVDGMDGPRRERQRAVGSMMDGVGGVGEG
ncbi:hypothetical protein HZA56_05300 [Candidatus Poribacteria bacterium]|nr:hypothetical protein [Candidatus Poribacteria bacterium]